MAFDKFFLNVRFDGKKTLANSAKKYNQESTKGLQMAYQAVKEAGGRELGISLNCLQIKIDNQPLSRLIYFLLLRFSDGK